MKLIRVNMRTQSIAVEKFPEKYDGLGGRGLTAMIISDEVPADCDALGEKNKLIFAPGYLSGTPLINTSRLSVGAKSPLTGGIKESNAGGTIAASLARLGIAAIVVEEKAAGEDRYVLRIGPDGAATLEHASALAGCRTYALVEKLDQQYGAKNSIACIGPAGEAKLTSASIQVTDTDGRPCRAAGRGGLGAVMGAKGLKALVVAKGKGQPVQLVDASSFKAAAKAFAKAVRADETSGKLFPELGTANLVEPINAVGAFPTRNARQGQFEHADKISGETLARVIKARGGQTTHKGCAQCIINCSNVYVDEQGSYVTSSLEYETIWSMGAMHENADLDAIARLDFLCDDIGVDTINTGVAIAVAMDAGYAPFGDAEVAIRMVEEIAEGTEFGKILGNGPSAVGHHLNHKRVPVVKGQSISAYDPRAIQGMAVTYATSPMGADHTAGWVVDRNLSIFGGKLDRFSSEGQVDASREAQLEMAGVDSLGLCDFARSGMAGEEGLNNLCRMIAAKSGKPFVETDWRALCVRVLKLELAFNRRAGLTEKDDRLPEMFLKEKLPPCNQVVNITDAELDATFDFDA